MGIKKVQVGFSSGEFSPSMYGRFDDPKYAQGLARCRNFIVRPQGPVELRPGTQFVRAAKFADRPCRLIPFTFTVDQTMVLEFGDGYIRFHTIGQTLMGSNGQPYEVATPYRAADLFELHYVQSMDVMTIVHANYPPKELRRYGATDWRLTDVQFRAPLTPPTITSVVFTVEPSDGVTLTEGEKTRYTLKYKVTAVQDTGDGIQESEASAIGSCKGNLYLNSSGVTITWSAVPGASRYRVYKNKGGLYSFIGETEELSLNDDNLDADSGITPPRYDQVLGNGRNPSAVAYFEQRRCFAGTPQNPQTVWMTRSGTESDLSYTIPSQSDNRIRFTIAAQEASKIIHLIPLSQLVALTNSTEYRISAGSGSGLAPDSIDAKVQANIGSSMVQPVIVNSTMVYAAARGNHVRELGYNWQASGFSTGDISIRSEHFFENNPVKDMALSKAPDSIIWCAMSDGSLIGCTYLPEQNICGWHRHDFTNGAVESVTTVVEGEEDVVYLSMRRTVNGAVVRYVERMHERFCARLEDAFHVDCGGIYQGAATKTISGLTWLEGQKVSVFANGCVLPQQTVVNGTITLSQPSTKVFVGLPITADFQTLPAAVQLQDGSYGIGHSKNINDVYLRVVKSSGVFVGPDFDHLVEAKQRTREPYGSPPDWMEKEISIMPYCEWNDAGQICVRQVDPLPLTIVSVAVDLAQ